MFDAGIRRLGSVRRNGHRGVVAAGLVGLSKYALATASSALVGSEKQGLSEDLVDLSDFTVRIPMRGRCDSLNVAVATGVLLFEMVNQRRGL